MRRTRALWAACAIAFLAMAAVLSYWRWTKPPHAQEMPVMPIPLTGGPERPEAEISSLAWYGHELVIMPQYPRRFVGGSGGALFALERSAIDRALDGRARLPLAVRPVKLETGNLEETLAGFDGYEAIAFAGDDVYMAIETREEPDHTVGYLVRGHVEGELATVRIDASTLVRLRRQIDLENTGYETLVVRGDRVIAIYEANGEINPHARALEFHRDLRPTRELAMHTVEYRITDATDVDSEGRFWVTNYYWPGSPWQPAACKLTARYGTGDTHSRCATVERLVELRMTDRAVEPTARAPILFQLIDDNHARNWEGVVRLGERGFLVMTDEYPASILAFVPSPH